MPPSGSWNILSLDEEGYLCTWMRESTNILEFKDKITKSMYKNNFIFDGLYKFKFINEDDVVLRIYQLIPDPSVVQQ